MLAQRWGTVADRRRRGGEASGWAGLTQAACDLVLGLHHDGVGSNLRMVDDLAAGQHGGTGHPFRGQAAQPLSGGTGAQHVLDELQPLVDVLLAQRGCLEPRIVQPFRAVERTS